jgi:phosphoglycolate phosphatase
MARWAVLDLDGTLVDSVPDLQSALNRSLQARRLADYDAAGTQAMVGDGARALLERGYRGRDAVMTEADYQLFLADYTANAAVDSRAYPDVAKTLQRLVDQGWVLAVCTNKPEIPARALLVSLGLDGFFSAVGGGDSFPVRKPHPSHLLATLAACNGDGARAVMVGDHHNDIHAASGAGVASVWARWGYGTDVTGATADAARFADLPELLNRLIPLTSSDRQL